MKYKIYKAIIIILCMAVMMSSNISMNSSAEVPLREKYKDNPLYEGDLDYYNSNQYRYYSKVLSEYDSYSFELSNSSAVVVEAESIMSDDGSSIITDAVLYEKDTPVFIWDERTSAAEFSFDIKNEGIYEIEMEYRIPKSSSNPAVRSLYIDGEIPFFEAASIVFNQYWRDAAEPLINSLGDEVRPRQVQVECWINWKLSDSKGIYSQPFKFYFKPGRHVIKLEYVDKPMVISQIIIKPVEEAPSYDEVAAQYRERGFTEAAETIEFQAENTVLYKNDPTIRRESDSDPTCRPLSYINRKLNVIGHWNWRRGQQSITWKFSVNEDGLYKIGIRTAQLWNDGLPAYRQIAFDGKIPYKEFEEYRFEYDRSWYTEILGASSGEPYLIYLEKGEHTLTMTIMLGELSPVVQSLYEDSILLSDMIGDIIKITGNTPDPNYDYELMETIPTLRDDMMALSESLQYKYNLLKQLSDKLPAMANNFQSIRSQLEKMMKDPFTIARRLEDLNSALTSLTSWYLDLQNQPLLIDYFLVGAPNEEWKNEKAGFFKRLKATIGNFLVSFKKDYDNIGSIVGEETEIKSVINIWVSRGTEWVELIKEMADEDFTPQTGILVNMNVMPASQLNAGAVNALMLAISSGKAPDAAMGVDSNSPVEFAIRNAVADLSKFENYDEVSKRFIPNILVPYKYMDGVFAVPETMNFNVMFYRKDILDELNIRLPDTREELYNYTLPVLYQNGMQFYYPTKDFSQFLFQHGAEYYTSDGKQSALDTPEAFRAFKEYSELFTNYGIPVSASFFNRMRTGEMPVGIGDYNLYITLSVSAPELTGRWGVALLPGIRKDDGTIDRSCGSLSGQCDIILDQSRNKEDAWKFLDWWTSTAVQVMYARQIESLIGVEARWNSANYDAFTSLSWSKEDLEVIREQWEWAKEVPIVLGGYFTTRHLNNAWNSVIIDGEPVRDAMEKAVEDINRELRMKQEEYGVE